MTKNISSNSDGTDDWGIRFETAAGRADMRSMRRNVKKLVLVLVAAGVAAGFGGPSLLGHGSHSYQARGHQYQPPKPPAHR